MVQSSGSLHELGGRAAKHFDLETAPQLHQLSEKVPDIPHVREHGGGTLVRLAYDAAGFVVIEVASSDARALEVANSLVRIT